MADNVKKKHFTMINFIWVGVLFSALYWILESIRDLLIFERGSIFKWIFLPESMSLWMRVLVICIIMLFSAYTQSVRQKAESPLFIDLVNDLLGLAVPAPDQLLDIVGQVVVVALADLQPHKNQEAPVKPLLTDVQKGHL